jgi:uncharacterized protein (DUF305 family)
MKKSIFLLAALGLSANLLSSCDGNKTTETTTTATVQAPAAAADGAGGMTHGQTADALAGASPQFAAMNAMMAKMDALKMQGNTDHDFAHMMLEHHRGAVVMADLELRDGKDAAMQAMATKIKADQQKEIAEMEPIAKRLDTAPTNYQPQNAADPFTAQMKASMTAMMQQMPAPVADPDMNFNQLMTVHHQSAIDMAKAELAHGKDTALKQMAKMMIEAQQKEIQQFKEWQARNSEKLTSSAAAGYECPMGDGGKSDKPGSCPKCGMDLEKKG